MKKTLFAVAALALCGTALALEYSTSDFIDGDIFYQYFDYETILNVDETVAFKNFTNDIISYTTLNFVGENTFSATEVFTIASKNISIMGDPTAATYWESELLKATDTPSIITLASAPNTSGDGITLGTDTFMGASKNESLTLGNTELTYVGCYDGIAAAKYAVGDNGNKVAVARVGYGADKGLYLVGKATAPVPEPATATLSLLALAGLCARRRRKK